MIKYRKVIGAELNVETVIQNTMKGKKVFLEGGVALPLMTIPATYEP